MLLVILTSISIVKKFKVEIKNSVARQAKKLFPEANKGYKQALKGFESGDLRGLNIIF